MATAIALGFLFGSQIWYLLRNETTIESLERSSMTTVSIDGKVRHIKRIYDLGWFKNISSVMGGKARWWWPHGAGFGEGNGTWFPTRRDLDQRID